MTSWTDPVTWATGDVPTAAQFNADLRDNPKHLYEGLTGQFWHTSNPISGSGQPVGAVNQAHLTPIVIDRKCTIATMRIRIISAASGNYDFGIYDTSWNRLWSLGSTAASSGVKSGSPALAVTPGVYWVAVAADSTVPLFSACAVNEGLTGLIKTKTSSFALPSSIATPSDAGNAMGPYVVLFS